MKYRHYAPNSPLELVERFESLELAANEAIIAPLSEKDKVNGGWFFKLGATFEDSGVQCMIYMMRCAVQMI